MTGDPEQHNLKTIRALLCAAFTPATLRRFCQDRPPFRPICNKFSPNHGLDDMVARVITHCETNLLFDRLLAQVEQTNPNQYHRFEADIYGQPLLLSLSESAEEEEEPSLPPLQIPSRSWWMLVLLFSNLGMILLWGWCLLRDRPELMAYLQTAFTILGVLVAVLVIIFVKRQLFPRLKNLNVGPDSDPRAAVVCEVFTDSYLAEHHFQTRLHQASRGRCRLR